MKKFFALIFSILLIMVVFVGCSDASKDIIGTWSSTTDISESINAKINATDPLKEALAVKDFKIVTLVIYREDGYYEIKTDSQALADTISTTRQQMRDNLISVFGSEDAINNSLKASNFNLDNFLDSIFSDTVIAEIEGQPVAGKYLVEGNKLYLSKAIDEEVEKENYIKVSVSGNKLTYKAYEGEGIDDFKTQTYERVK